MIDLAEGSSASVARDRDVTDGRKNEEGRRNRGSIQILGSAPKGRMRELETML
ncbi:hypothetical protein [Microcoleus sp. S13_B4]|uniref:hypothetical protein n=1 Tax=Microcoleus sp. S13_B4 TaxID=3055408 RepID=UPI002FD4B36D